MSHNLAIIVAALALVSPSAHAQTGIRFRSLGSLPEGGAFSVASAVSADGNTIVGHALDEFGVLRAVRWTLDGPIMSLGGLPTPAMSRNSAKAVSADGGVVAIRNTSLEQALNPSESVIWTADGLLPLGRFPGGAVGGNIPEAISGDGLVIAGLADTPEGGARAFRWSEVDGWENLGLIPGALDNSSRAYGVNSDGSIIVGHSRSPNTTSIEAFRWTRETGMVGIGDLPGGAYKSDATAVSADGSVIVGYSRSGPFDEAFRWTPETGMVGLGFLFDTPTTASATAVSADGEIIVGYGGGAWVWDEVNGMRSIHYLLEDAGIDLTGWHLGRATGVAHLPDGTTIICGWGDSATQTEGWIAVIPTPSSFALLILGAGLAARRRRCAC